MPLPMLAGSTHAEAVCGMPTPNLYFNGILLYEDARMRQKRLFRASPPVYRIFEHAGLLADLLSPHSPICIALNTSWAERCFEHARQLLPIWLADGSAGSTVDSKMDLPVCRATARGAPDLVLEVRRDGLNPTSLSQCAEDAGATRLDRAHRSAAPSHM